MSKHIERTRKIYKALSDGKPHPMDDIENPLTNGTLWQITKFSKQGLIDSTNEEYFIPEPKLNVFLEQAESFINVYYQAKAEKQKNRKAGIIIEKPKKQKVNNAKIKQIAQEKIIEEKAAEGSLDDLDNFLNDNDVKAGPFSAWPSERKQWKKFNEEKIKNEQENN